MKSLQVACFVGVFLSAVNPALGQIVELAKNADPSVAAAPSSEDQIDFLRTSGVEFFFQGPGEGRAELVKLRVGNPNGFNLPLYFFVGATGDALSGESPQNEPTAASILNPLGGNLNLSFNKTHGIVGKNGEYTSLKLAYQGSGKVVNGKQLGDSTQSMAVLMGFVDVGLLFQTAAWMEDEPEQKGVFFAQAKFAGHIGPEGKLKEMFGSQMDRKFWGFSAEGGVRIDQRIDLKIGLYKTLGTPNVPLFADSYVKFAFDIKRKP